jgi:hypothetical protein
MPWTIPNLLLHDKPVPLANMRSLGRTRVFVYCSNPTVITTPRSTLAAFPTTPLSTTYNHACFAACAIIAAPTSARRGTVADRGWQRPFEDPIPLPDGRKMLTLKEAANYIMKLPKGEQHLEEWQAATEALMMAAEDRGPLMHARIGVMRALNRNVVRKFDSSRKDTHWGRRKLKREE